VRNRDGSITGIISERDLVRAIADESVAALGKTVAWRMKRVFNTSIEIDKHD
jgi:hypothetical protein